MPITQGVHHITAIVDDPQENMDFYAGVLGLKFLKKTVNFDDPTTYHLYFGNAEGDPGTAITFFPWPGAQKGVIGNGQVGITYYAIAPNTAYFWEKRLHAFGVKVTRKTWFDETALFFTDPHGLKLALIERDHMPMNTHAFNGVSSREALRGFIGAEIYSAHPDATSSVLTELLGYEYVSTNNGTKRFKSAGPLGNTIDVSKAPSFGAMGVGTVHHIAFRAKDSDAHEGFRSAVLNHGFRVTPFIDRDYFYSIYFRETGGVLFEIATDEPGFTVDEPIDELGCALKLPKQHEHLRSHLEKQLPAIRVREVKP